LFESSASKDYFPAFFLIARCYEKGLGVNKDPEKARQWLQKGIESAARVGKKISKK
jgi:TPR repeat protein